MTKPTPAAAIPTAPQQNCPACQGVEGATHTCPGSGTWLGEEGHDSSQVVNPLELPRFTFSIQGVVRDLTQESAAAKLSFYASQLMRDELVDWVDVSVQERS